MRLNQYSYMIESGYLESGNNIILLLSGHNGYDDTICHYSKRNNYNAWPSMTMYNTAKMQMQINSCMFTSKENDEPFYIISGFIDLDKFKIVPIKDREKSESIRPDTNYIIYCGNNIFKVACSSDGGKEGGYFTNSSIQGYIPILPYKIVGEIFKKHNKIKRKLNKMKKDFE